MSRLRPETYDFLSSQSPQDDYELIQRIGSGTYGDVYKVNEKFSREFLSSMFFLGETYSHTINASIESD